MFGKRIKLFKLFGFEVGIDLSWLILTILTAWSLSVGLFPARYKGLPTQTYWLMGIIGALGLFFSIVQLVEDYIYKYHHKMFPIVEETDRLVGCVMTKQVKEIPREEWGRKKVGEIAA